MPLLKICIHDWADLLLCRSVQLLVLTYAKIACLHVSFTIYEYFYKLSKRCIVPSMDSSFYDSEEPLTQESHIYTYTLVSQR